MHSENPYQSPQEVGITEKPAIDLLPVLAILGCLFVVAVHFALRAAAFARPPVGLPEYVVPPLVAMTACVCWSALRWSHPSLFTTIAVGAGYSLLSCLELQVEFVLAPGPYNWRTLTGFWPVILMCLLAFSAIGAIVGSMIGAIFLGLHWLVAGNENQEVQNQTHSQLHRTEMTTD